MKKLATILLLFAVVAVQAQEKERDRSAMRKEFQQKMKEFTPEQKATLRVKQWTLALDLTSSQQSKLIALETKRAGDMASRKLARNSQSELTSDAIFELKKNRLDRQIAYKKEVKSILTESQFEKWERLKRGKHRRKKHRRSHKKR